MTNNAIEQFQTFQTEIIGKPPNKITQYGTSIVLMFILILIFFSWKIDYSDSIKAKIVINSKIPTINVVSEHSGNILQIFTTNDSKVNVGDNIILFRSDSDLNSIIKLKTYLLESNIIEKPSTFQINGNIGSLREDYQILQNNIYHYLKTINTSSMELKIKQLQNANDSLSQQLKDLISQKKLYKQKNTINQAQFNRSLSLSNKNIINKNELGNTKSNLIDTEISSSQIDIEIRIIKSKLYNNTKLIELYYLENRQKNSELTQKIQSQKHILLDKINSWERNYIIKAPISGIISLPNNVFIHQNILLNQELFSINPEVNELVGKIKIPENGVGKINIGQSVDIKLDSYPFQEFGKISGIVKAKSKSVHESSIYIDIKIKNYIPSLGKLNTSYNKNISYIPNMQGQVEIITNKKNILARISETLIARL